MQSLTKKSEKIIEVNNHATINEIFGEFDENLEIIKRELNVDFVIRDNGLKIYGDDKAVDLGEKLFYNLVEIVQSYKRLEKQDLKYTIELVLEGNDHLLKNIFKRSSLRYSHRKEHKT